MCRVLGGVQRVRVMGAGCEGSAGWIGEALVNVVVGSEFFHLGVARCTWTGTRPGVWVTMR